MKTLALLLFAGSLLLTGCETTGGGDLNTDFAAPDNLENQRNIQELHSRVMRQEKW